MRQWRMSDVMSVSTVSSTPSGSTLPSISARTISYSPHASVRWIFLAMEISVSREKWDCQRRRTRNTNVEAVRPSARSGPGEPPLSVKRVGELRLLQFLDNARVGELLGLGRLRLLVRQLDEVEQRLQAVVRDARVFLVHVDDVALVGLVEQVVGDVLEIFVENLLRCFRLLLLERDRLDDRFHEALGRGGIF